MALLRMSGRAPLLLTAARTSIGHDAACDVVIADPDVASRHAAILQTDRGWLLVDESGGRGVIVNDRRVGNHFLAEGDRVSVGGATFVFSERNETLPGPAYPAERRAKTMPAVARPIEDFPEQTSDSSEVVPASLDPVVEVYSLGAAPSSRSVYTLDGADERPAPSSRSVYTLDGADERPAPSSRSVYTLDDDDRRRAPASSRSVYTLDDADERAAPSSRSLYTLGTAPTVAPPRAGESGYALGDPAGHAAHASASFRFDDRPDEPGPARGMPAPHGPRHSGESWSWVQPEPGGSHRRAHTLPRPGRGMMLVGLALLLLGILLVMFAFALGASVDEIPSALGLGGSR